MALFTLLMESRIAHSEPSGCEVGVRDHVSVDIASTIDPMVSTAALAHLAAELATRQIIVCTTLPAPEAQTPLARLFVTGSDTAFVNLRVRDEHSHTTVERSFDLSAVPPEGRSLTLGLAADALLSMLWSGPLKTPKIEPPPPIVENHPESLTPSPELPRFSASVLLGATGYPSGPTLWGPQLQLRRIRGRWLPSVYGGLRRANALRAAHGRVAFQDAHLGLELGWLATRTEDRLTLVLLGGVEGSWVSVAGEALEGNTAKHGFGIALLAYVGVEASIPIGESTRLMLKTGGGHALRPVRAVDSGVSRGGVEGVALQVSLGLGASF